MPDEKKNFFFHHSEIEYFEIITAIFVAFVEDNATMSSIEYFENHVSHCAKPKEVDPIKLISL